MVLVEGKHRGGGGGGGGGGERYTWGINAIPLRRQWRPTLAVSVPSRWSAPGPGSSSAKRKSACIKVDLPLPVRPMTPTYSYQVPRFQKGV